MELCNEVELCDEVELNWVNRDVWTTDVSGSLVPVYAPRSFADKAAGSGESVLRRSHLILRPLYYLAVHHLPGSLCVFLLFKIE